MKSGYPDRSLYFVLSAQKLVYGFCADSYMIQPVPLVLFVFCITLASWDRYSNLTVQGAVETYRAKYFCPRKSSPAKYDVKSQMVWAARRVYAKTRGQQ